MLRLKMAANWDQAIEDASTKNNNQNYKERNNRQSQESQVAQTTLDEHQSLPLTNLEAKSHKLLNLMAFPAIWEKILLHLEDFSGLLQMRLVCKTWKDYIDQWIMVPAKKKQFVQRYLIHPWLCYSLTKAERSSPETPWYQGLDVYVTRVEVIGDFCILLVRTLESRTTYDYCVLHKGQYLGRVSLAQEPCVWHTHVKEILLLNKSELLIVTKVFYGPEHPLYVWRLRVTFKEDINQFSMLEMSLLNDHPLFKDMQILTLHNIINDTLVVALRTTDQVHQLIVTSLRHGWQNDMTKSMNSDWCWSQCQYWKFGWHGNLILVPDIYLPGVLEHTIVEDISWRNKSFLFEYHGMQPEQKAIAITENFICKKYWSIDGSCWTIESIRMSDGVPFCSTIPFKFRTGHVLNNKNFAVYCLHNNWYADEPKPSKILVFSDKEEMWFSFTVHQDEYVKAVKLIHNVLIVGTIRLFMPKRHIFFVHDLEQRGKRVRTLGLGQHLYDKLTVEANMLYYVKRGRGPRKVDPKLGPCAVVNCFELRAADPECDTGFDG